MIVILLVQKVEESNDVSLCINIKKDLVVKVFIVYPVFDW